VDKKAFDRVVSVSAEPEIDLICTLEVGSIALQNKLRDAHSLN